MAAALPPRIVVAGTHSGVGKTTVATGLMAALRRAGHRVGAAKVGPDFIDPGYHGLAAGRPSRNLDIWMSGAEAIAPIAWRAGDGTDVLVVEGVMGMFDGAGDGTPSSTADVAVLLDAPVVLVVDTAAMSRSVAAVVHGFATYDPRVTIAGVVLNRVAGAGHEQLLREALDPLGIPVVGVLGRDDRLVWRDRHLGLVPVAERGTDLVASIDLLARLITASCDLPTIVALASGAGTIRAAPLPGPRRCAGRTPRVAVAAGPAFSFSYVDNLEALAAAGAELVPFDPLASPCIPDGCDGMLVGGGFPEVYAEALSANAPLLDDVRAEVAAGLAVWAECGGLLWLGERLDDHAMAGVLPVSARMTDRLTLGYRVATSTGTTPLGPTGTTIRGHEFHYSATEPPGDLFTLTGRHGAGTGGFGGRRLVASYVHTHLAARPDLAASFVAACAALRLPYAG